MKGNSLRSVAWNFDVEEQNGMPVGRCLMERHTNALYTSVKKKKGIQLPIKTNISVFMEIYKLIILYMMIEVCNILWENS